MAKHLPCVAFLMLLLPTLHAQNNFTLTNFRVGQSSYADISGSGTAIAMSDNQAGASISPQEIGFSFNYNGTAFTQFMIHADGILRLGNQAPGASTDIAASPASAYSEVFTTTAANFQNIIMPFFTNLVQGSAVPQFHVSTTGTAPGRVCTIQWKNLRDADNTSGGQQHQFANLEFQVKLYETTNDIEFVYGAWVPSAGSIAAVRRNGAAGIKASSSSFLAFLRPYSNTPFHKVQILDQPRQARFTSVSHPFIKSLVPSNGLSFRFFGRITNDISIGKIYLDSIMPAGKQAPGNIEALVKNEGTAVASNIQVKLDVSGVNTHTVTVNIPTLAAGAEQNVTFPEFDMPVKGVQHILVTATADTDERAANNTMGAVQKVSQSNTDVYDNTLYVSGIGYNGSSGLVALKIYGTGTRKISQIRIPFLTYRNAVNVRIYEDGGTSGSPSASPIFTSSSFFTTNEQEIIIPVIPAISVEGNYFVAVQQQTTTNMGWGVGINTPMRLSRVFNNTIGTWAQQVNTTPWQVLAKVYEENAQPDIGIERLVSPGCTYANDTEVKVTLRNFSSQLVDFSATPATITGFVRNPSGAESPFTIQKNTGTLAAGASEEVTVLTGYDFSTRGSHRFEARTNFTPDVEPGNDSLLFFINNRIAITSSASGPVCPLTEVTLTGVNYLANPLWDVDGMTSSGSSPRVINPIKTTVVKFSGVDYRGCTLMDSIVVQVTKENLPPKPILIFGDTLLSHRNRFVDTVRVKKLAGHTIKFVEFFANGTVVGDSTYALSTIVGMNGAKVAAAYVRISDGCANLSDTISYRYITGVLHNNNEQLTVCDTAYYDFGGPISSTGGNFTRTFIPSTPGTKMKITFYRLDLATNSGIQIFDGPTASNRIVDLRSISSSNIVREFTSSHETGALTIQFSFGSFSAQGWWAGLTCYTPEVYRTVQTGNWITASTWERKAPGGNYKPALRPPVKGDDTVYVRHNITLSASTPMDQVVVEEGATLNIENPAQSFISMPVYKTVTQPEYLIKGTLNISPRVQIFGSGGQMIVPGRLNNFGQIDLDSVVFNGTTPQILGNFSGASGSMKRLHINNAAGLTLNSDQTVTGIRFVNGLIKTDSENMLTLTNGLNSNNFGNDQSHVSGPLTVELPSGSGNRLFPIGKNGKYRPVLLSNNNSNSESSDKLTAEVFEGAPPQRTLPEGISNVSELRFYRITRNGNSGLDFRVTLPYLQDDGVTDPSNLTIVKDNGAGDWINIGGTASGPVPGIIQSGVFNGFSDFVLANNTGGLNPLPITWLEFKATAVLADAHLEWRTKQEHKCADYEVERSSDGVRFNTITKKGCNNATGQQAYEYVDANPGKGSFYYRIKQVDSDGKFEYSPVRKVSFGTEGRMLVYPNPARDRILISDIPGNSDIRLYDAGGRLVLQSRNAQPYGQLHVGHLPAGIYLLTVTTISGEGLVKKVQIEK